VLADARQVEHEGLLKLEADLVLDALEHLVLDRVLLGATQVVVPVGRPRDVHRLAADDRVGPGDREVLLGGCTQQDVVVVSPRLVVVLQ